VLLIVVFWWQRRRRREAWLPVLCVVIAGIASLGGVGLGFRGHVTPIWLPWRLFWHLPVLRYAIPARLALFVILPAALIVAIWLADRSPSGPRAASTDRGVSSARGLRRSTIARWGLALLAVAFVVPAVGNRAWNTAIADPSFFQHGAYRAYLSSRDHVLTIPAWGPSQRWVADAGFPFALSTGSGGQGLPASYTRYPIWNALLAFPYALPADYATQLRRFLVAKDVTAIVVEQGFPGPWRKLLATLGVRPVTTGGVLVYRLDRRSASGT
jgi:hypothetical protein